VSQFDNAVDGIVRYRAREVSLGDEVDEDGDGDDDDDDDDDL